MDFCPAEELVLDTWPAVELGIDGPLGAGIFDGFPTADVFFVVCETVTVVKEACPAELEETSSIETGG